MVRVLAAAMAALLLTACVSQPAPSAPAVDEQAALAEDGRDLGPAEANCSADGFVSVVPVAGAFSYRVHGTRACGLRNFFNKCTDN